MAKRTTKRASAVVEDWVMNSKARSEMVWKESTQRLIEEIQTPVAKGGRMRVDTGFLRATGQASLTGLPTGPTRAEDAAKTFHDVPDTTIVTIAKANFGGKIFFGWTANYAKYREYYDGFLRLGVQNWPQIVAGVIKDAKARFK